MIREQDLVAAIAECQGERNPTANTCIKLAAYYTIKSHLYPTENESRGYAHSEPPDVLHVEGKSAFTAAVNGRRIADVWPIVDELMLTLQVLQPRLYNAVMDMTAPP